jgi:hypothetical protein
VRALLAQAQVEPELAKALRENWTLPRRKLVYESLEGAVKEREVRNDIDIEAAIDGFYAPVYHPPQMSMGTLSEAQVDKIFGQTIDGQKTPKSSFF